MQVFKTRPTNIADRHNNKKERRWQGEIIADQHKYKYNINKQIARTNDKDKQIEKPKGNDDEFYHFVQNSKATILLRPRVATGRQRALKTSITLNTGQGILRARIPRGIKTRPEDWLLCLCSKEWESSQSQQPCIGQLKQKQPQLLLRKPDLQILNITETLVYHTCQRFS